jgi:putative membrane protein
MEAFYNYLIHLLSGLVMVALFAAIYLRVTPFCERADPPGLVAPALSFGGATLGFSLTVASSILHNDSYPLFLAWGGAGLVTQLLTYALLARLLPALPAQLSSNNVAAGAFAGTVALVVGIINAACMS